MNYTIPTVCSSRLTAAPSPRTSHFLASKPYYKTIQKRLQNHIIHFNKSRKYDICMENNDTFYLGRSRMPIRHIFHARLHSCWTALATDP